MSDLIDRKQLLSIFHDKAFDKANTDIPYRELKWAIKVIKQAPPAEKTGEWIETTERDGWICSNCGSEITSRYGKYSYCPCCGAKMV